MTDMTTSTASELMRAMRCFPLVARAGFRRVCANVCTICLSSSFLSVTTTMRGRPASFIRMYLDSITIVSDFPLPCVCQITPLCRLPRTSFWWMVLIISFTAKYC